MNEEEKIELFQYRAGMTIGSSLYLFFGWYSQAFLNTNYDTFLIRLPIGILGWTLFLISFKSNAILKSLRYAFLAGMCLAFYQYMTIFAQSNYDVYFSVGLMSLLFVAFNFFSHIIDITICYVFMLVCGYLIIPHFNQSFVVVFLIDSAAAFFIYIYVIKRRVHLLKMVKDNLAELRFKQTQIDDKNKSLIKIGELAAQVAHDIRSPVTALDAVSQMLGDEIDPKKKKLIENAAKRINDIANNLVSNYRENLTQDLSTVKIDRTITLNSLIDDIIEEKRLSLDSNHKIIFKAPESISLPQNLEPSEFQRVISNLINNSIEAFDKESGIIDIHLYNKGDKIELTIRDNGKGIPKELINKAFERGISGKNKGAGLGLSHAKEYIESLGGSIDIESIPTKETRITIQLKSGSN